MKFKSIILLLLLCSNAHGDITSNLLHSYSFNENTGTTVTDTGSGGKNGTFVGTHGTWQTSSLPFSSSVSYYSNTNASNDSGISFGTGYGLSNQNHLTWAFWAKSPFGTQDYARLLSNYSNSNNYTDVSVGGPGVGTSNDILLGFAISGVSGSAYTTSTPLSGGAWKHVAIVYDGTQGTDATKVKIYINAAVETLTFTGTIPTATATIDPTPYWGILTPGSSLEFRGAVDELRVYTRSLSSSDVTELYNFGKTNRNYRPPVKTSASKLLEF